MKGCRQARTVRGRTDRLRLATAGDGTSVKEVCQKLGFSEAAFYRWKKRFVDVGVVEIRRLKQLEEKNAKLKRLVADLSLHKTMSKNVLKRKFQGRASSDGLRGQRAIGLQHDRFRAFIPEVKVQRDPQTALRIRLQDAAAMRARYGYRRLNVLLRREGWSVNHKHVV